MDQVIRNSFELVLREWVNSSILFRDPAKWRERLQREIAKIPRLEEVIKALRLEINLSLQSLLFKRGFNADEVVELLDMPATAIDIIDSKGGLEQWRKNRRKQHSQPSVLTTL